MDSLDIGKVCVRRWYVFVPVLAVALVAGHRYAQAQPASYTAAGSFGFIYPSQTLTPAQQRVDPRGQNPLASISLLTAAVVGNLTSPATAQDVQSSGGRAAFTVTTVRNSPVIFVNATGSDPAQVLATANLVMNLASERTTVVQTKAGAPANSQYKTLITTKPAVTKDASTSAAKLLIGFGAVGVLAGAALALLMERWVAARRRKRAVARWQDDDSRAAIPEGADAYLREIIEGPGGPSPIERSTPPG